MPSNIAFVTVNGDHFELGDGATGEPPSCDEDVKHWRAAIALRLRLHPDRVRLLCQHGDELEDGGTMQEALAEAGDRTDITIVIEPCRLRPAVYEFYICREGVGFQEDVEVAFPEPSDININMMPFVLGDRKSLPDAYQHYWHLIEACDVEYDELGKVGYLTIQESLVQSGSSQRRPGLHIESPGESTGGGELVNYWGGGAIDDNHRLGGIYLASSLANSCRLWDARVTDPVLAAGAFGDLEHLRDLLGTGTTVEPNRLYWLTDTTPHESLPLEEDAYRQFFRLVTSQVSTWYTDHNTPSPCGIEPPEGCQIVEGDKFS